MKNIVVTGGAGNVAYHLSFLIAGGRFLGSSQPISLRLIDLPEKVDVLRGIALELEDCAFPLLKEIQTGSDPAELFGDAHFVILAGARPRGPNMERKDLLLVNGTIFAENGKALERVAARDARIFVVGNPCNTNCLIAMHNAPSFPRERFFALTRLDQNRATFQLAQKAHRPIETVTNVTIWGNHSSTQIPDFVNARIGTEKAQQVIHDRKWLEEVFVATVQKRGAEIIRMRGQSAAASAAHAVIDMSHSLRDPTAPGQWFSAGVFSEQNPYGIAKDLVFSFPCISRGNWDWKIVPDLEIDDFLQQKLRITEKELREEKDAVKHLLKDG